MLRFAFAFVVFFTLCINFTAADEKAAQVSRETERAIQRMRLPAGHKVALFAAEPHLANPVAFCIDENGRFYIAETFRLHHGVTDTRGHMYWLNDDLACRTVADRLALYRKHLGKKLATYAVAEDRVRLIEDRDGDGKADHATVFAGGFNRLEDGLGSGVLARGGNVWFTNIPSLWLLRDSKGTGRADFRKPLHTGYGVHVSFIGHDMHGLRFGPDGKLYFSIGDRGLNVTSEGRHLFCPDTGAVLRCNPDGSELEIVATGLRNPQELAFDKYGNLFTGDNNADSGDRARWVYVVEGGDSGWRIGYQYMRSPAALGPWNAEKLWHLPFDGQAAYIVPPLAHIANGPSGLTYDPGTGLLADAFRDHFFLCDFRGGQGGSGIHSFAVKPRGASFEVVNHKQFLWSVLATDCDFGPDGALYLSDWVDGWNLPNKGRIYKVFDPARLQNATALEVKKLIAAGFSRRSIEQLCRLLEHADMRVRQEAQFELAARGCAAELQKIARHGESLARLHAIWGLGQIGRNNSAALGAIADLTRDSDAEVRSQAAKILGDCRFKPAQTALLPLLRDPAPRVQFFAALSLGKLGFSESAPALFDFLRSNADKDPYLRHAGVMSLTWIHDKKVLEAALSDASVSVRLAAALAMRRLEMPEIAQFLNDADPRVVVEAARAINDVPIAAAMPALAGLIHRSFDSRSPHVLPILYRVLNAHFRLGQKENALTLAAVAGRKDIPERLRVEALRYLELWARPPGLDRVVGLWRPLAPRSSDVVREAVQANLGGIVSGPSQVRTEGASLAARLGIRQIGSVLRDLARDSARPSRERIEAIRGLEALKDTALDEVARLALNDADGRVRHEGRRVLIQKEPPAVAVKTLTSAIESGAIVEAQGALALLGEMKDPAADHALESWLDRLLAGKVPAELTLDLIEAAKNRDSAALKSRLSRYQAARSKSDPLAPYRESLMGGDADRGRQIFFHKAEVSCVRCHKIAGQGGEVGPDLSGIGARQKRDYLLEAIVDPNRQIAKGFETVVLVLRNGKLQSGILKSEDARSVRLVTAEGRLISVPRDQIEERGRGKSAMPEDVRNYLSPRELRDLIEFLAGLRQEPKAGDTN